jgi:hypothetical protein
MMRRATVGLSVILFSIVVVPQQGLGQTLYGIVSEGRHAGYLVQLEIKDGSMSSAVLQFQTSILQPAGLTYDPVRGVLLTIDSATGQVYSIDLDDEKATILLPIQGEQTEPRGLAYRRGNDSLYSLHTSIEKRRKNSDPLDTTAEDTKTTVNLLRLEPTTGIAEGAATIGKRGPTAQAEQLKRLAVRASDGALFGAGNDASSHFLFKISSPDQERFNPETSCTTEDNAIPIAGIDFHPTTGVLYASDGISLFTLDPADPANCETPPIPIGEPLATHVRKQLVEQLLADNIVEQRDTEIRKRLEAEQLLVTSLSEVLGTEIGEIGGIAFETARAPDVWIRGCSADIGNTPSECEKASGSPDIWIDNNADMRIDPAEFGKDNELHAQVRNRGEGKQADVSVAFYYWNCKGPKWLIGRDTVRVPPKSTAIASVVWPNVPKPPGREQHWCIAVVLDQLNDTGQRAGTQAPASADRAQVPRVPSDQDNNVATTNTRLLATNAGDPAGFRAEDQLDWWYPIAQAERPLVMQRGMFRGTASVDSKWRGQNSPLVALDFGVAFAVDDHIEVGISNFRLGSTPPKAGQGALTGIVFSEGDEKRSFGDVPVYLRGEFLHRDVWRMAADVIVVLPSNTKLAATLGLPIRVRLKRFPLAIDWGVEATVLTSDFGANVEVPVKITYNVKERFFFFGSSGLSLQQLGRSLENQDPDSNVAYEVGKNNQILLPFGLGLGGTLARKKCGVRIDFYGQMGWNPLIYFNPPPTVSAVETVKALFVGGGLNIYSKPVLHSNCCDWTR